MTAPARPGARHIELRLQLLDGGRIRVSTPQARGHASVARGPDQLWHAVAACFREATIAGHARWRGEHYDHDVLTEVDDPTEPARTPMPDADQLAERRDQAAAGRAVSYGKHRTVRPDVANPADWSPNADGSWTSPKGRRWTSPKFVVPVLIARSRMGLSVTYDEWVAEQEQREGQCGKAAAG